MMGRYEYCVEIEGSYKVLILLSADQSDVPGRLSWS
jgi:hypothetical protein